VRFELTNRFHDFRFSRPVQSTTLPTFLIFVATSRIELEIKPYESFVIPFHHLAMVLLYLYNGCRGRRNLYLHSERVTGIEPASPVWKTRVMTIIRYSLLAAITGFEPVPHGVTSRYCKPLQPYSHLLWGR
jgi:hypothetical protein